MLLLWQTTHESPSCRDKNNPKSEWDINKAQQSYVHPRTPSSDGSITSHSSTPHPTTQESVSTKSVTSNTSKTG
jgi:hypothetical protein